MSQLPFLHPPPPLPPPSCYDTKVTSATWAASRRADVLNGPTTAGDTLPPFSWTPSFTDAHEGQPYTYDFTFEAMTS